MNSNGDIKNFPTPEDARAAGYNMPLSAVDFAELEPLPHEHRLESHIQNRREVRTFPVAAIALAAMAGIPMPRLRAPAPEKYPGQRNAHLVGANRG